MSEVVGALHRRAHLTDLQLTPPLRCRGVSVASYKKLQEKERVLGRLWLCTPDADFCC